MNNTDPRLHRSSPDCGNPLPRLRPLLVGALLTAACVAAPVSAADFEPPHWAGDADAAFSAWIDFTVAFGEPGNAPDGEGSTGDAVLVQTTPGASVTGGNNIYNPAGASAFVITDIFDAPLREVVLEVETSGTELLYENVRLVVPGDTPLEFFAGSRTELARISGGFGDTVLSRWRWSLPQTDATSVEIHFAAGGAHCSLVKARLDTRSKSEATAITGNSAGLDRWNYRHNGTPGTRSAASTFRAASEEGLSRHAQYVFGFDTAAGIDANLGEANYEIVSAEVVLQTSSNFDVAYDSTPDAVYTYLPEDNEAHVADTDTGRPLELFGAGFRNGLTALTWEEDSPFTEGESGLPTVHPVAWNAAGEEVDAYMNVNFAAPYEAMPFAVGRIDGLAEGANIPEETDVRFELNLDDPGVVRYLQHAFNQGRLMFAATSLHSGGQGDRSYPEYYTSDSLAGDGGPSLALSVRVHDQGPDVGLTSIVIAGDAPRLRFAEPDAGAPGVRWTTDFKTWHLERNPALTSPEDGVVEWTLPVTDDTQRFYQVYLNP